jgi:hypothetical protein
VREIRPGILDAEPLPLPKNWLRHVQTQQTETELKAPPFTP